MSVRVMLGLAVAAGAMMPMLQAAPAGAADLVRPGGPPALFSECAPPPSAVAVPMVADSHHPFRDWMQRPYLPRITDVERYDPLNPPAAVVPKYVTPQTAYLATPLCDFPNGVSDRSWYDGKLFYQAGGVHSSPDTFMVIERK